MSLRGFTAPLSPDGRAGIVPPPPWHYSGDFLIAEYRTDPDAVEALLPPELEPAEDPGAVAAMLRGYRFSFGYTVDAGDDQPAREHRRSVRRGPSRCRRAACRYRAGAARRTDHA